MKTPTDNAFASSPKARFQETDFQKRDQSAATSAGWTS
jgi:hypothetical protein